MNGFARNRVCETNRMRMKSESPESTHVAKVLEDDTATIRRIAENRMQNMPQMTANLMVAPRARRRFDARPMIAARDAAKGSHRRHSLGLRSARHRVVDRKLGLGDDPARKSPIFFFDSVRSERVRQIRGRVFAQREDQRAARSAIEPVCRINVLVELIANDTHRSHAIATLTAVDRKARRFVDDSQMLVLIKDGQSAARGF